MHDRAGVSAGPQAAGQSLSVGHTHDLALGRDNYIFVADACRRRRAISPLGALVFPEQLSRGRVQADQGPEMDQQSRADQHWRRGSSVVGGQPHVIPVHPAAFSLQIMAGHDARVEEYPNRLPVAHGRRCALAVMLGLRRGVGLQLGRQVRQLVVLAPKFFAAAGIQADQQVGFGRDENARADHDGRRVACADLRLPKDVLGRRPLVWRLGRRKQPAAVSAPPHGVLGRRPNVRGTKWHCRFRSVISSNLARLRPRQQLAGNQYRQQPFQDCFHRRVSLHSCPIQ